jgi:hypothetical protein
MSAQLEAKEKEDQSGESVPQLGALEEDDEFEEFPVQGTSIHRHISPR